MKFNDLKDQYNVRDAPLEFEEESLFVIHQRAALLPIDQLRVVVHSYLLDISSENVSQPSYVPKHIPSSSVRPVSFLRRDNEQSVLSIKHNCTFPKSFLNLFANSPASPVRPITR